VGFVAMVVINNVRRGQRSSQGSNHYNPKGRSKSFFVINQSQNQVLKIVIIIVMNNRDMNLDPKRKKSSGSKAGPEITTIM